LIQELQLSSQEATESFYLLSDPNGNFHYRDYILDYFPNYAKFLTGPITARAESVFTDREPSQSVYGGDPS
jgi:hypothetical protein